MNLKPQDLRLGILIHDTVRNTNTTLQLKHFRELSISEEQFFNRYKPVAITDQMLLDFGFDKELYEEEAPDEGHYYSLNLSDNKPCDLSLLGGDESGSLEVSLFPYDDSFYFTYAHEIQSLYYSLNGEELNISKFLLRN